MRLTAIIAAMVIALGMPVAIAGQTTVGEAVESFAYTKNMQPMGYSARVVPPSGAGAGIFNSDLAFWGNLAIQGTYEGFRLIDISQPDAPAEIANYTGCVGGSTAGNQGDVIVWGNVLVRSWNSPAPAGGRFCGDVFTPAGQEGIHVFDISNPAAPVALTFVATPCGSHTATGVPDTANNRILVYNSPSSGAVGCRGLDILEVPLGDPGASSYLRFEPSGDPALLPFEVVVASPSAAAGTYQATGAEFGPAASATGIAGAIVPASDGSGTNQGCNPFVGFPAGAIALVDRGTCGFVIKAANAQAAGASAMIVANNAAGAPITMGGSDPSISIPSVMVSQTDGAIIKLGLPATGTVKAAVQPANPDRPCHDTGVILGSVNLTACAGGSGFSVWSMDPGLGGSLDDPALLYSKSIPGVTIGHSASFTWDGDVLVFGHEPGGGGQAQCQATSPEVNRTLFFFEARTGDPLGTFLHPRPQTATENCTWHNYNVVPTDKRYVLVSGSYQSGVSVIDFTNPASAFELAYADPAPLSDTALRVGGDWSTYWYDGRIYESDITRGLIIWSLNDKSVAGAKKLGHLNPQTQETSFDFKGTGKAKDKIAGAAAFAAATANAPANPVIPPGTHRFDLGD